MDEYYNLRTWLKTSWMGHACQKYPSDLFILQEILYEVRPALVIEFGTAAGGSALFMATVLDQIGNGLVLTVDQQEWSGRPIHPRIQYLTGSTRDPKIRTAINRLAGSHIAYGGPVLIDHDSDHSAKGVRADLHEYAHLVTPGSYFIVEDTILGGPLTAVRDFVASNPEWEIDESREKFRLTMNWDGYLRRKM